jgi:hypothetical protein
MAGISQLANLIAWDFDYIANMLHNLHHHAAFSAFEAEDVHWLNSREAACIAFERAIAREDRCNMFFSIVRFIFFASLNITYFMNREDLQEFRLRAAASGMSRNLPTSQIAIKEKEDSHFVPGVSKQMGILSRLGIKVCISRYCTLCFSDSCSFDSCCAPCGAACECRLSPAYFRLQRKGPDSVEHAHAASKSTASIDSATNANCGISGASKDKNAAAPADASRGPNVPTTSVSSASPSAASTQIVSSPAATSGSGLSALLDYDDSDD